MPQKPEEEKMENTEDAEAWQRLRLLSEKGCPISLEIRENRHKTKPVKRFGFWEVGELFK